MGFRSRNRAQILEIQTDVGDINDATTDTLMGKIGTDTEMADRSLFDLLGGTAIQGFPIMVPRATATLPQTAAGALFTITGGNVEVISLVGEVTTIIQTQANDTKLVYNPTAAGASTDLCAVLDITGDVVGTIYTIDGTFTNALAAGLLCSASAKTMAAPIVMAPGTIDLNCAASNSGSVEWFLVYRPLQAGASVAAAA